MAQSKKKLLKRIDRRCRQLHPQVKRTSAELRKLGMLDAFGSIWGDAYHLLHELQRMHSGTLQKMPGESRFPVTYQRAQHVYEQLQLFSQRIHSSR